MSKGNSSAKFGVVSPLWNRKGRLAIKVSRDLDSWERETSIYKKLWGGGGPFVSLYDAEPNFDGRGANMLIQDYGEMDLLDYINENGPLSMRDIRRFGRRVLLPPHSLGRAHVPSLCLPLPLSRVAVPGDAVGCRYRVTRGCKGMLGGVGGC